VENRDIGGDALDRMIVGGSQRPCTGEHGPDPGPVVILEEREEIEPNPIPEMGRVYVGWIVGERQGQLFGDASNISSGETQQWAHDSGATAEHPRDPGTPRASEEIHQHRFCLVVPRVAGDDHLATRNFPTDRVPPKSTGTIFERRSRLNRRIENRDGDPDVVSERQRCRLEFGRSDESVPDEDPANLWTVRCDPGSNRGVRASTECDYLWSVRQLLERFGR
jgi:hypothetical protein